MGVPDPEALRLVRTFEQEQLKLPGDREVVDICGMSAQSDDVLLCADCDNRSVKSVCTSSGAVSVLFQEADDHWLVSNCILLDFEVGRFLAVAERTEKYSTREMRVAIAGPRNASGSFPAQYVVPLPEHYDDV